MGEPPRDGKKNDVQREDEIRRLQEMVSSLQVGVEELKKKPRKGSRKLKRRPSRGDEAKDDDDGARSGVERRARVSRECRPKM